MTRPGLALLPSMVSEDRLGAPGPAREAALQAAEAEPQRRAEHLFDAAVASLHAGTPRRALHDIERFESLTADDAIWQRRAKACRAWATQLDWNAYPGGIGAEIAEIREDSTVQPAVGDPETMRLELVTAMGPGAQRVMRTNIDQLLRNSPGAVEEMLVAGLEDLERFSQAMVGLGSEREAIWGRRVQARLLWHANRPDDAMTQLVHIHNVHAEKGDPVGMVLTRLQEGDWFATPASSPEALGYDLAVVNSPSPLLQHKDLPRARAAYEHAHRALEGLYAPQLLGALHLRFAVLNRLEGGENWFESLHAALEAYKQAGDEEGICVTLAIELLSRIDTEPMSNLNRELGSGWSPPRDGPIAMMRTWVEDTGSASFTAGLGRLLERDGDRRRELGDLQRAGACYLAALPLVELQPGISTFALHSQLADVDRARNLFVRSLVRLERAAPQLSPVHHPLQHPLEFMQQSDFAVSVTRCVIGLGADGSVEAIEHAAKRIETLLSFPGLEKLDDIASSLDDNDAEAIASIAGTMLKRNLEDLLQNISSGFSSQESALLAHNARVLRQQLALLKVEHPRTRAEQASRAGRSAEADLWFNEALRVSREPGVPAWMSALVLIGWGRDKEASAVIESLIGDGVTPALFLIMLALRAGNAPLARRALGESGVLGEDWRDATIDAELALAEGRVEDAQGTALRGLAEFEGTVAALQRDPERIAACDDTDAASLHLTAALATLGTVAGQEGIEPTARDEAHDLAFRITEQGRSMALDALIREDVRAVDASVQRPWWQAAAEWAAVNDMLLTKLMNPNRNLEHVLPVEDLEALDKAEAHLVDTEVELDRVAAESTVARRTLTLPPELAEVRSALPEGTLMLAYFGIRRDTLAWAISRSAVRAHHATTPLRLVSSLVHRFQHACALGGEPAQEGQELERLLLSPFTDLLQAHERLLILPSGPLHLLPFHALPWQGRPLGLSHTLSYLPSAAMVLRAPLNRAVPAGRTVIVGDPAFDPHTSPKLSRLAGAGVEGRAVQRAYSDSTLLEGPAATEAALRAALADVNVLHLAAHGRLDGVAPMLSSIVLSGSDHLTVADLMGIQLEADLAVLSACDSGRGRTSLGADVVGLVRGLLAAGVDRAVLSLWPVDDITACITMVAFHERLASGEAPARALAHTQRELYAMTGPQVLERYEALGGAVATGQRTTRRGELDWDPELADDEELPEPLEELHGNLARVWAPFVLVGS